MTQPSNSGLPATRPRTNDNTGSERIRLKEAFIQGTDRATERTHNIQIDPGHVVTMDTNDSVFNTGTPGTQPQSQPLSQDARAQVSQKSDGE